MFSINENFLRLNENYLLLPLPRKSKNFLLNILTQTLSVWELAT